MAAAELGGGTHTEKDVLDLIIFGRAFLWVMGDSGILCEFEDFPQMRICRYWVAGGDLETLLPMEANIEAWARSFGATRMEIVGRAGWQKKLAGYKRRGVWMTKDLADVDASPR